MQIYLARNNVPAGPYTLEQLNSMLVSGEVQLTDLAWHEGLSQWQLLYELTEGEKVYQPEKIAQQDATVNIAKSDNDNKDVSTENQNQRISVDELYGREPKKTDKLTDDGKENTEEFFDVSANHVKLTQPPATFAPEILAGRMSRVIATLLDWLLFLLIYLPLWLHIDADKFVPANTFAVAHENAEKMLQDVPQHIMQMTSIFLCAYVLIQCLLVIRRGRTLGKIFMGIKVLDVKTAKVPSFVNGFLIRGLLTNFIYLSLAFPLMAIIDFIFALFNSDKRCLHDKLAGTIVVKAKKYEDAEEKKKKIIDKLT